MNDRTELENEPPLRETFLLNVDQLRLDRLNPRLLNITEDTTDAEIIASLYSSEDLGELLQSIASNGYLNIEPLVILGDAENFTVLEGNRRLAAIYLFKHPELVDSVRKKTNVRISVPPISDEHRASLDHVSVYRVATREEAWSFIGFKHVNGAARWSSYAKAKFAAEWFQQGDASLTEISKQIGDRHETIKRMVGSYFVLEQAEENEIFSIDDRKSGQFSFSHLYTALSRAPFITFVGLDTSWSRNDPVKNPIQDEFLDHLRELLNWIYGSEKYEIDPVVRSQNPDIARLADVLKNQSALSILRSSQSLDEAYESILPPDYRLTNSLRKARDGIREAVNNLRGFDGQDTSLVDIAEEVADTAQVVHRDLVQKSDNATRSDE